jgi:hypothetical protein
MEPTNGAIHGNRLGLARVTEAVNGIDGDVYLSLHRGELDGSRNRNPDLPNDFCSSA